MGVAPLAIAEIFSSTPTQRLATEDGVRAFLLLKPEIDVSACRELSTREAVDDSLHLERKSAVQLKIHFLKVDDHSCYGRISAFPANIGGPTKDNWLQSNALFTDLVRRGLCSSALLRKGCESRGLFGSRFCPSIVANEDFSKMSILKRFEMLNLDKIGEVVGRLSSEGSVVIRCEDQWKKLASACRNDPRFAPALVE